MSSIFRVTAQFSLASSNQCIFREETSSVHRVIEKSSGIPMYARIYTNPSPAVRLLARQQMLAMQSAAHNNVIKLINVIENSLQVVIMYEM